MFNFGESADGALPERALALAAHRTSGSMTLRERVHDLFEQLHVPVFRYLLRKTRDSGRAEDITQETFLRLFRHLREDRQLDNPKAWIFTVANNLAIDASRDESHIRDLDESTWKNIEESRSDLQADPEKLMLQRENPASNCRKKRFESQARLLHFEIDARRRERWSQSMVIPILPAFAYQLSNVYFYQMFCRWTRSPVFGASCLSFRILDS